jgi:hypothetical protein
LLGGLLLLASAALWIDRSEPFDAPRADPRELSWSDDRPSGPSALDEERSALEGEPFEVHADPSEPLEALTGRVIDAGGGPIAGAVIAFRTKRVSSDDQGAFIAELPRGIHFMNVFASGYAPANEQALVPGDLTIALLPEAVIEGRLVQGESEEGVPHASLLLLGTDLRAATSDVTGAL